MAATVTTILVKEVVNMQICLNNGFWTINNYVHYCVNFERQRTRLCPNVPRQPPLSLSKIPEEYFLSNGKIVSSAMAIMIFLMFKLFLKNTLDTRLKTIQP